MTVGQGAKVEPTKHACDLLGALAEEATARRPARPIMIGGVSRSGTTLLGAMLGTGPRVFTVPEARFKWRLLPLVADGTLDVAEALDHLRDDWKFNLWGVPLPERVVPQRVCYSTLVNALVRAHARHLGVEPPPVWIDHTPWNLSYAASLSRLLPEARFVHVVRDGRAVAASALPLDWGPNDITSAAHLWAARLGICLAAVEWLGPERAVTVSYEDLVRTPRVVLERLRAFLDLPAPAQNGQSEALGESAGGYQVHAYTADQHALVTRPPDLSRVDAWRDQLSARQVEAFEAVTAELLTYLGYEPVYGAAARSLSGWRYLAELNAGYARRWTRDRLHRRHRRQMLEDDL